MEDELKLAVVTACVRYIIGILWPQTTVIFVSSHPKHTSRLQAIDKAGHDLIGTILPETCIYREICALPSLSVSLAHICMRCT